MLLTALYLLSVVLTAALIAITLVPLPRYVPTRQRYAAMIIGTLCVEFPWIFLLAKFLLLQSFAAAGIFAHPRRADDSETQASSSLPSQWSEWIYCLDVLVFLGYWALLLQTYFARTVVENATWQYKTPESTEPPSLRSGAFWLRIANPFWRPRNVKVHSDIVYATEEELNYAGPGMDQYMSLDVHHHPSFPRDRPVFLYIHAGSYTTGSKSFPIPPFIHYLTSHKWVVVSINTRLTPAVPYPAHLVDAKRALRWTKANISRFGGDPRFICVGGVASGAHLASMIALTANDPFYQPGFESVDTSVRACVAVNAILDVTDQRRVWGKGFTSWFAKKVCGGRVWDSDTDREFLLMSSPVVLLKRLEEDRRKSVVGSPLTLPTEDQIRSPASPTDKPKAPERPAGLKSGDVLPPFLIFHGAADSLIPVRHVRDFVSTFKKVSKSTITYVEFPNANHMYNIIGCRAHYMAYGIERFLSFMHAKYAKESDEAKDK